VEVSLEKLKQPEQHHISVASSVIHRRVTIRSEPSLLMANYSKIKRVEPLWSRIVTVAEGNWNIEEREGIEEVERGIES